MQKPLLAKSRTHGELTLQQHLLDTETAALAIFKGRILKNWCRFFKFKDEATFLKHLQIAALFHDIGKANADFYGAVTGSQKKQTLRHEWLSALILHLPDVRSWLNKDLDLEVITAAVLCHHLQADRKKWGEPRILCKRGDAIELYLNHPEAIAIFTRIGEIANVEGLPKLPSRWVAQEQFWNEVYQDANDIGDDFTYDIKEDSHRRGLLLAVKAGLIAADSVASGIFRTRSSQAIQEWVEETLHKSLPITREEIETKILQPRYRKIEQDSGRRFELKPFQEKASQQSDRTLLLSGCGTGKTIFGYKWHQAMLDRNPVGHVIFLYPTRGTATEGFKDYISWAPEADASLLTGTARYELNAIAENPTDSTQGKDYTTEERLFALGFWNKRFFSATVDQFLSFLTHQYSGLCLLPVLSDSVVVIDEVHSFSRGMFDNLVSFLQHFDIPILCMTATLPKTRRQDLERVGLQVFASSADAELQNLEKHPRYQVTLTDFQTARQAAIDAYQRQNYRVLWVVNTVDRCREIAGNNQNSGLESELKTEVLTYHSRFKLGDRQNRHRETIEAFAYESGERKPAIAVTTQVCEMSLDLDADVLITELAPISALVQRFGRSNRHLSRGLDFRAQIFVYEPPNFLPYNKQELNQARNFIQAVEGTVSQFRLAEALEQYSLAERFADGNSSFIDGGYWATSAPFRENEDNYLVNALLNDPDDLASVKTLIENKQSYDGYILPIPKRLGIQENRPDWMPTYLALADCHLYCPKKGFGQ